MFIVFYALYALYNFVVSTEKWFSLDKIHFEY